MEARIIIGNNLETLKQLPDKSVQTCVTSPPYWGLRDYGNDEQLGLEETPSQFVENLCKVFDEIWRVMKDDGTLWVNLGDSYAGNTSRASNNGRAGFGNPREGIFAKFGDGLKNKDLAGIPWRFAFAMQDRGWYLRQDIIWHKPNPMPESVTDRCTKAHEYIFLLTKKPKYYYDHQAIKEQASSDSGWALQRAKGQCNFRKKIDNFDKNSGNGSGYGEYTDNGLRNKRSVWSVNVRPYKEAHFATYPPDLIEPCILAGSKEGDLVLDPFSGSGTTGEVAIKNNRNYIGLELNPEYAAISERRLEKAMGMLGQVIVS